MGKADIEIERAKEGRLEVHELNRKIDEVWDALCKDPSSLNEFAADLGVDPEVLASKTSPFVAKAGPSGIGATEVIIFLAGAFAQSFFNGAVDAVRDRIVKAAQKAWDNRFRNKISPLGSDNIGDKKGAEK